MPLIYRWPYALFFWAVLVWAFAPEFRIVSRPAAAVDPEHDAGSKTVIVIGQMLATFAAFTIASRFRSAALSHAVPLFWTGVGAIVAGSLLRRHCFRMLGASFTGAVIVRSDHTVVERGAYRYVRHPSYTAGAILFLGIGLALGNWISLVVLLAGVASVYAYRVAVEERALVRVIGEPYVQYMNRTKRFVPFVF